MGFVIPWTVGELLAGRYRSVRAGVSHRASTSGASPNPGDSVRGQLQLFPGVPEIPLVLDIALARLVILVAGLTAFGSGSPLAVTLLSAFLAILAPALAAGAALVAGAATTLLLLVAILPLVHLLADDASFRTRQRHSSLCRYKETDVHRLGVDRSTAAAPPATRTLDPAPPVAPRFARDGAGTTRLTIWSRLQEVGDAGKVSSR